MPEPKVRVTIVDDPSVPSRCGVVCGTIWSQSEVLEEAKRQVVKRFGRLATLEYVDMTKLAGIAEATEMKSGVKGLPMPVLLANGRPRIAGEFDVRQILDVIEADLEAEL